jgi:alkylhydroperoxidase family enzyme
MGEWLAASGLTAAQIIYFCVMIGVAYLSAKLGASESRRQYEKKAEIEKRQAAADLIHSLLAFAFQCDRCISDTDFANSAKTSADRLRVMAGLPATG